MLPLKQLSLVDIFDVVKINTVRHHSISTRVVSNSG